jgi:hypothetical protein
LIASGRRVGHHQVWARDSMIALLGGALTADPSIQDAVRASVAILREHQASTGAIPNNVNPESGHANFRAYADGGLWWIIGSSIVAPDPAAVDRVFGWSACQDTDQSGLLSMQESADWQDLFCTRGKGLYLNCLYKLALDVCGRTPEAARVADKINEYFWYRGDGDMLRHVRHTFSTESQEAQDSLGRRRWLPMKHKLVNEPHYLPWLGFRAAGEWFDSLGNLLAIISGVADEGAAATILDFIERSKIAERPAKALCPVIRPGDPDWRDYYGMLNSPEHYHNGGIWPFIGGFYVAALVKAERYADAESALARLAALNESGEFNEWHHGTTGEPMGVQDQAWSAGMYIYAYECVRRRELPWLTRSSPATA